MLEYYLTPEEKAAKAAEVAQKAKADRMIMFRKRRNEKLTECDWTQLPDAPLSAEKKAEWALYRQALRDVPATANADGWVTWPNKPS